MELCKEGLDNLTVGIVKQAADDYLENRKKWFVADKIAAKPIKFRLRLAREFVKLTSFFADKWFNELCTLDPSDLIRRLDDRFDEWKSNESEVDKFIRTYRNR
jgi:hypothetical protein